MWRSRLAYLVSMFAHVRGICDMLCENFVDTFSSKTKKKLKIAKNTLYIWIDRGKGKRKRYCVWFTGTKTIVLFFPILNKHQKYEFNMKHSCVRACCWCTIFTSVWCLMCISVCKLPNRPTNSKWDRTWKVLPQKNTKSICVFSSLFSCGFFCFYSDVLLFESFFFSIGCMCLHLLLRLMMLMLMMWHFHRFNFSFVCVRILFRNHWSNKHTNLIHHITST